jgi:hypothetical protein
MIYGMPSIAWPMSYPKLNQSRQIPAIPNSSLVVGNGPKDGASIANIVDFMRHQKKLEAKKVLKLQGILKGHDIDLSNLKQFKKQTWQHVEHEFADE